MVLPDADAVAVQVTATLPDPSGRSTVHLYSAPADAQDDGWTRHATGTVSRRNLSIAPPPRRPSPSGRRPGPRPSRSTPTTRPSPRPATPTARSSRAAVGVAAR
ncbi:polyketide synthase dehydratase domain-containing protein [Streptomyces sp. SCSIO-PteL053]|nr:polyketide synthase dehydratase domain-containing protein [Streptomyces sp. SCSIO-PteL053]